MKVFDFGDTEDGLVFLVMELLDGAPLSRARIPMKPVRALSILRQVARAVGEAHSIGLIHRDLKPDNVMLSQVDGADFVRVLDYGIAKLEDGTTGFTDNGVFVGTPSFTSPEQLIGDDVDRRCDIYTFGLIAFELLSGEPPFQADDPIGVAVKHLQEPPPPLEGRGPLSDELKQLVARCLAKLPDERPASMEDVVLAIDISGSMDARDFAAPDGTRKQRLEGVREVVRSFVEGREGDRMALIVFGTRAYVQAPLTEDLGTILDLLDRTEVGMAGPHTALGDAIGLAIRTFEASDIEQRLLILLSDGTDTASRMSPVNAAEIARGEDVAIFTVGVGDPEASGEDRVDLATLRDVAARTGGAFFFADDEAGLREVYARIDALAPREVETLSYRPRQSLAWIPLALAALNGMGATGFLALGDQLRTVA